MKTKSNPFRIAIYTRVSTEEQAENPEGSIKNQEERLRDYVKLKNMVGPFGEVVTVFSDPGKSAKDMNRPGFQRLMKAIENGEVNLILVTELSRLTRAIKDFSLLQEFFKKHGCEFLSLRENFDTTSATGGMVLNIMATIAEFERRQTAERIAGAFHQRAKRGLYNGGSLPLGYRLDETKPGHLAIVPEEAEIVRLIFKHFLRLETMQSTARWLNEEGINLPRKVRNGGGPRAKIFRIDNVHHILHNKAYIGVRVFKTKEGPQEVPAVWNPIIDDETFYRAAKLLKKNISKPRSRGDSRYPFTLSGVLCCKICGKGMSGKSAHGRNGKIPYYEHSQIKINRSVVKEKAPLCEPHRIQAAKIEPHVWRDVKAFLTDQKFAEALMGTAKKIGEKEAPVSETLKLEGKLKTMEEQIEVLAERIGALPRNVDPKILFDQLAKFQNQKGALEGQLTEAKTSEIPIADEPIDYGSLSGFTEALRGLLENAERNPEARTSIIKKLVHKIEMTPTGCEIHFHVGKNYYQRELGNHPGSLIFLRPKIRTVHGSSSLTNGGFSWIRS